MDDEWDAYGVERIQRDLILEPEIGHLSDSQFLETLLDGSRRGSKTQRAAWVFFLDKAVEVIEKRYKKTLDAAQAWDRAEREAIAHVLSNPQPLDALQRVEAYHFRTVERLSELLGLQ